MYAYVCAFGRIYGCGRVLVRARAGTTESTERNTEKTLVKGKRPLCLPFQSNRPPLSPLSFSLCPRFGSSCSLPAKSSPLPLSFSHGLSSSTSLFPSLSAAASPLLGFLFVLPSSPDLRLTHPEERRRIFSLLSPSLSLRSSLLLILFHPVYISDGQKREAQKEPCQKENDGGRRARNASLSSLCARVPFLLPPSLALPSALSLHPLTSPIPSSSNLT